MTMFQKIAFVGSPAEAGRMHSLLETAGFHPREDSSAHGALADAQHGGWVEVPENEAREAAAFLKQQWPGRAVVSRRAQEPLGDEPDGVRRGTADDRRSARAARAMGWSPFKVPFTIIGLPVFMWV